MKRRGFTTDNRMSLHLRDLAALEAEAFAELSIDMAAGILADMSDERAVMAEVAALLIGGGMAVCLQDRDLFIDKGNGERYLLEVNKIRGYPGQVE